MSLKTLYVMKKILPYIIKLDFEWLKCYAESCRNIDNIA